MNKKVQISDSLSCGILLALSGGCMDAYSYLFRDKVFANAQTGNMLLLGVNLASGNFKEMIIYFWPVLAFILGIVISDIIKHNTGFTGMHWRQISVGVEAIFLLSVAFIPQAYNILANSLISFACGIQVESFRKIHGNAIATTMCIGNLRSGMFNFDEYIRTGNKKNLKSSILYFTIIFAFVAGAVIESLLLELFGSFSIIMSVLLLIVALLIMFQSKPTEY